MSFVWVSKKPKDGVATLYESNITLNKAASSHFDHAYSVLLGLDEDGKKIAVKPITKEEFELGAIPEEKRHKITVKASYARVCNKKFMKEISDLLNIALGDNSSFKYKTKWSREDSALIIDLNKPEV
jgi:heme oxygenase